MRTFGSSCLLLLVSLLTARPAAACSCVGGGFGEYEPCESWRAAGIFAGKVTGVTYVMPDGTEIDGEPVSRPDRRIFHFDVIESFAGVPGKTADVVTGMGDGDCGVDFTVGESYFVYAGGVPGGPLGVSLCGDLSKPLARAEYDLAFARQVQRGEWTSIYGRVASVSREDLDDYPDDQGMPGVTVRIRGPRGQRFDAVTNEYGWFKVKGRLRGTFSVRPVLPEGFPAQPEQEVEVEPDDCAGAEILVSSLGTIEGRVVDLHGKPVESMAVALMPVHRPHDAYEIELADTDETGGYRFENVPAGVYLVAADHESPRPTYYPHAGRLGDAGRVTIKPAESLKLDDIRLPE